MPSSGTRATRAARASRRASTCCALTTGAPCRRAASRSRGSFRMRVPQRLARLANTLLLGAVMLAAASVARADLVRGVVRDQDGQPVFGADFNVYDPVTTDKLLASDKTDVNGAYRLVLDPGVYDLLCQVKDVNVGLAPVMKRNVQVSGTVTLDYVLPPSVRVFGRVNFKTSPASVDSVPVYPCNLDFDRTDDGARQPSLGNLTSPFGTFVDYIEAGSYTVTANPEDTLMAPTRVYGWAVPTTEVLELHCQPASYLASVIRDSDGHPVQGAVFRFDDGTGVRHPATKATSDAGGFIRAGVEPGVYRVTIEPPVGSSLAAIRVPGIDLTTHRQQDFTLEIGAAVSGLVTDKQGRPVGEGDWDAILEATEQGAATPGDNTGLDGRYRFVVAPGTNRLRFTPPLSTGLDTLVFRG